MKISEAVGLHYENPVAVDLIDSQDWTDHYPEVDGDGYLTGNIIDMNSSDADSYINVDDTVWVRMDALSQGQLRDVDEWRMGGVPEEVNK